MELSLTILPIRRGPDRLKLQSMYGLAQAAYTCSHQVKKFVVCTNPLIISNLSVCSEESTKQKSVASTHGDYPTLERRRCKEKGFCLSSLPFCSCLATLKPVTWTVLYIHSPSTKGKRIVKNQFKLLRTYRIEIQ